MSPISAAAVVIDYWPNAVPMVWTIFPLKIFYTWRLYGASWLEKLEIIVNVLIEHSKRS